ncbi:MAG: MoxR family ATPase [Candidatus Binatia bacterium]|nr:MoxR family ATPase [Candidatus Binatia bacterium]
MNINQIIKAVEASYPIRQPLFIWGPPGVGKSTGIKTAAGQLKVDLIDLRLPLLEPVDLRGLPVVANGKAKWSIPSFLPTTGKGILFLDEMVQAAPSMQAAASQLVLDRKIGEYKLPDGWHVVAAGNRLSDRASTNAMPTHIANRFVHITAEVDVESWILWALANQIDIRVVAFIKWRSQLLHQFDAQAKLLAFPSPRSWAFVSNLLSAKTDRALLTDFVRGSVGDGAASEFMGFLNVFDKLPSIDAIMLNPKTAPIPTDPAVLYAVVTTLTAKASADNIGKIVTFFNRLTDEAQRPEFSILAMKEITSKDSSSKILQSKPFMEWAAKHSHMIA